MDTVAACNIFHLRWHGSCGLLNHWTQYSNVGSIFRTRAQRLSHL